MDQYVSVFGRENSAILIDCRSLEHRLVPIPTNVRVVAVNSMVKHELGSSAYRDRVAECAAAVRYIQRTHPEIASLRDARPEMIEAGMGDVVMRRARHVVTEDDRCLAFAEAAEKGDLKRMGELFVASHRSLQHDYEVSCEELDFLVDTAIGMKGVYGARMTGGGFGGCTVNLVAPDAFERFASAISDAYRAKYNIVPKVFECQPSSGAGPVA
jgi:galactokinase